MPNGAEPQIPGSIRTIHNQANIKLKLITFGIIFLFLFSCFFFYGIGTKLNYDECWSHAWSSSRFWPRNHRGCWAWSISTSPSALSVAENIYGTKYTSASPTSCPNSTKQSYSYGCFYQAAFLLIIKTTAKYIAIGLKLEPLILWVSFFLTIFALLTLITS